jgi:hypothetical protein
VQLDLADALARETQLSRDRVSRLCDAVTQAQTQLFYHLGAQRLVQRLD